jgi:hypothetical protein
MNRLNRKVLIGRFPLKFHFGETEGLLHKVLNWVKVHKEYPRRKGITAERTPVPLSAVVGEVVHG